MEATARRTDQSIERHAPHAPATADDVHQEHPIRIYLIVWGWLFILSACSYYMGFEGYLRWGLILAFMMLKAGLILAVFMHMVWERPALSFAILLPPVAVLVFVAIMVAEADHIMLMRMIYFGGAS